MQNLFDRPLVNRRDIDSIDTMSPGFSGTSPYAPSIYKKDLHDFTLIWL